MLAQLVKTSQVSEMEALRMDENITLFEDCLGTCERILKTPIPLSYTRQARVSTRGRVLAQVECCLALLVARLPRPPAYNINCA